MDRYASRDIYDDGDYKREVAQHKKTNHLLVYPQLGKVKPSTYNLPGPDFTYGWTDDANEEGAGQVVGSWKSHHAAPDALQGRDFVRLNKYAAVNGCTTAKNVSAYRRANDIRVGQGAISGSRGKSKEKLYFPNADTIFGRPSAAKSSFSEVLNNSYQRRWIEEQRASRTAAVIQKRQLKYARASHTRASLGHTKVIAPETDKLANFRLKQFQDIPSRVRAEGYSNLIFPQAAGAYPEPMYADEATGAPLEGVGDAAEF
eukprot:CAMPEP_0175101830 /NCGR_PEP_ID=MMETSP0086_2-20121207/8056_1 /TAXON_ID=136419 /ORGANISM="Unknown Unknown, Strain D1" /LENGTH=258 /DNA_ID=CAMNT_0016376487 /DNA_START=50 /DNA_END=826 /DNA_ORIENTATION=+